MKRASLPFTARVLVLLGLGSLVSVVLLLIRVFATDSLWFTFMVWNLFLAWLPLLFALGLRVNLANKPWLHWQNIGLTFLWLGFLPNSFYLMSDLIHLQSSGGTSIMYDIAMLCSFIFNGLLLGYISTYIVHARLLTRVKQASAHSLIGLVFLACGFAIYLGRYLRWNTWDVLVNPTGLLFDLSERVVDPFIHAQTYITTLVFFVVIASTYAVLFELVSMVQRNKTHV
jgi:uncharacterized membrane protein